MGPGHVVPRSVPGLATQNTKRENLSRTGPVQVRVGLYEKSSALGDHGRGTTKRPSVTYKETRPVYHSHHGSFTLSRMSAPNEIVDVI